MKQYSTNDTRGAVQFEYVFLILLVLLVCFAGVEQLGLTNCEAYHEDEFGEAFDSPF